MTPEEILDQPAQVLTQAQRESYMQDGFLLAEGIVDAALLTRLQAAADQLLQRSRHPDECTSDFEFETPQGSDEPSLRQVLCSADYLPELWAYASEPPLVDLIADVVGPNIKFFQANVSFKAPGGRGFPWHQDLAFIPSSNRSPLMAFTFLEDVTSAMGPTELIPGSHRSEVYDHYDEEGNWLGVIGEHEVPRLPVEKAVSICGPAGSVLLVNCGVVHSAKPNRANYPRPMVISGYSAADSICYVDGLYHSRYNWRLVRGQASGYVHNQAQRMKMPPDWSAHQGLRIDNLDKH